ncbi:MAG: 2-oxoacid:acceptor oxidoreductase family protein [Candidatus Desulfofervidaceae bacterium]|nr:2-oxoacid:acceptor oxidoreductase family protein [Candidatus Desulfofervidaceae bacterium]MDL1969498.1 thiamine pyrophosphate-dependent enzyme [Candidatus Desulfofervidaceae bacterium]
MGQKRHPMGVLIREDRMPHIFCPGCGIGATISNIAEALLESSLDPDKVSVVSGIGCSGRAAGYFKLDGFHTTHGRPIAFATGLKLTNPDLTVIVFSGDGDLTTIGGNHLIHAARRNMDMIVICINNFNYGMTGGQMGGTTPTGTWTTTSVYGNYEMPFNLPLLLTACGANYVARWTSAHSHYIKKSFLEALEKEGFCFIEVISACPINWGRRNKLRTGKDMVKFFLDHTEIKENPDPAEALIQMDTPILCGVFANKDKPGYLRAMRERLSQRVGIDVFRGDGKVELPETEEKLQKTVERPKKVEEVKIKLAGIGGQGIALLGLIMGRAACIFDGNQAVYSQEYGAEARGGASASSVIISSGKIDFPYIKNPDVMVVMAQGAFRKYRKEVQPNSILFIDKDLVKPYDLPEGVQVYAVPATRLAEQVGRKVVANIVMLGFISSLTDYFSLEAVKSALKMSVPKGTEEFNLKAFEAGYTYGEKLKRGEE